MVRRSYCENKCLERPECPYAAQVELVNMKKRLKEIAVLLADLGINAT